MTTIAEYYERVNAAWPADLPALTGPEAVIAARKLYRFALGRTWQGETRVTSGRRYTWVRHGVLTVNPGGKTGGLHSGWVALVHDLSHYAHNRLSTEKPHSRDHARLELRMAKQVVARGWLNGALRPAERAPVVSDPADAVRARIARIDALSKRWKSKQSRATNALAKLAKERARLARKL